LDQGFHLEDNLSLAQDHSMTVMAMFLSLRVVDLVMTLVRRIQVTKSLATEMTMMKTWMITAMFKKMMMITDCDTNRIDDRIKERTMVHLQGTIRSLVVTETMKEKTVENHDQKKIVMAMIKGEIDLRTRETLVMEVSHQITEEIVDVEADRQIEENEGEVVHHMVIEEEIGGVDLRREEEALHLMVVGMIEIVTDHLVMKITLKPR